MSNPRTVAKLIDVEQSKIERWIKVEILLANGSGTDVDLPESEIAIAGMLRASVNRRVVPDDAMKFLAGYFRSALNPDEHSADEREAIEAAEIDEQAFLAIRLIEAPSSPCGYSLNALWQRDRNSASLWLRATSEKNARTLDVVDLVAALKPRKPSSAKFTLDYP